MVVPSRCEAKALDGGTQLYGVAEDPQLSGFFGRILGGIGALAGLPCLGVVIGGIMILAVAMRRASHKRTLQQQVRRCASFDLVRRRAP